MRVKLGRVPALRARGSAQEEAMMSDTTTLQRLLAATFLTAFCAGAWGVDAEAAKALARQNGCFKCHSADKEKQGPSFKATAAKYKGKADAEQSIINQITTGPKDHMIIKTKDPAELKNLAEWILAQ
jgi:cytochrome c